MAIATSSVETGMPARRKNILPRVIRRAARVVGRGRRRIPLGEVRFGDLDRLDPLCADFGFSRGTPVDRYYIENFLAEHAQDVKGRVLEIADPAYTRRFGGSRVERADVLHAVPGNNDATITGDLSKGDGLETEVYDAVILTQTLLCIYDIHGAIENLFRILKPGGVALVTLPGVCKIARYDLERWGDFWRFTNLSARRLFEERFPATHVEVRTFGNVLVSVALLHGICREELKAEQLDHNDPDYQVTITVRAEKPRR